GVGLSDGETIGGRIPLLVTAFASRPGDAFEPTRAETPAPIPTWAWVLFLIVAAWGMWFVATEFRAYQESMAATTAASTQSSSSAGAPGAGRQRTWAALGAQVYGNKCSACRQLTGQGLRLEVPPVKGSPVVTSSDPTEHIRTVLHGLSGKTINGVVYGAAMPAFADQLTDEEVAAVLSYERTSWGNQASPVKPEDVLARRGRHESGDDGNDLGSRRAVRFRHFPTGDCAHRPRSTHVTYRIHQSRQPGASVFVLSGVLDIEHAERLQELLATAVAGRIVLDLKDIT